MNGLKNDKGRYIWNNNGDFYEGQYKHDKIHGQGVTKYASGNVYDGEYKDNKMHG